MKNGGWVSNVRSSGLWGRNFTGCSSHVIQCNRCLLPPTLFQVCQSSGVTVQGRVRLGSVCATPQFVRDWISLSFSILTGWGRAVHLVQTSQHTIPSIAVYPAIADLFHLVYQHSHVGFQWLLQQMVAYSVAGDNRNVLPQVLEPRVLK